MLRVSKFVLELVKIDPLLQAITVSSICKTVFRTKFWNMIRYILSRNRVTELETASLLRLLKSWLYFSDEEQCYSRRQREVHFVAVSNVKVEAYCQQTNELCEYVWCFGMGVLVYPIDTGPSVRYWNIAEQIRRKNGVVAKNQKCWLQCFDLGVRV
jgi:hypothetical protein